MFLSQFMYRTMTWFFSSLWGFLCWCVFKIFFFLEKYIDSRIVDENDEMECKNEKRLDCDEKGVEKECSFLVQSKYEYISSQDSFGFMEKPEAKSFSVQEMFMNFNEGEGVIVAEEKEEEIDKNSDHKLFYFSFFKDGSGYQEKLDVFDGKNGNDKEKSEVFDGKNGNDKEKSEVFDGKNGNDKEKSEVFDGKNANDKEKSEVFDEKEANFQEKGEEHVDNLCCEEILKQNNEFSSDEETQNSEDLCYEIQLLPENQSLIQNSIRGAKAIGDELCSVRHLNGFLNSDQFIEADREENDNMGFIELETSLYNLSSSVNTDEFDSKNVDSVEATDGNCEEMKLMNDFKESSDHNLSQNSLDMDDFASKNVDRVEETDVNYEEMKLMDSFQESVHHNSTKTSLDPDDFASQNADRVEETDVNYEEMKKCMDDIQESPVHNSSRKSWDTDSNSNSDDDDDDDEDDILLEHQNLVRQMKMEMKNSRMTGLPTISEDCESPKVVEDLKPLKINDKIEYKDSIEEIQKFYKSYAEKMRKLDILNYQTLNAISFLQLKDSEVFMSSKKNSISITKAFALPSFLANKQRKIFADPAQKSISEMNRDLEIVYVGQICLSWEILYWQFGKAKELFEHDPQEYHTYNQVAGEYQQFQVLLQRFVEDEPFQGPRVQNYVRKRCMLRSFLQVPCIRDDRSKGKQGGREMEKDVISIVNLGKIIKETMQVFWEFLCADKREANLALKSVQGMQMDTAEIELFMNVKLDLQKKERKLKDVQRSGNCIVKRFQKQQERRLSHSLFASLVELKLVSRVLSLPRLRRDYLVWCQRKLSNINVAGRKVSMEQSFSLFPC